MYKNISPQTGSSNEAQLFVELQMQKPRDSTSVTCSDAVDLPSGTYQTYLKKKVMAYRNTPDNTGLSTCFPSGTAPLANECLCGNTRCGGANNDNKYCYDLDHDGKEECHTGADQQATTEIAAQFGEPKVVAPGGDNVQPTTVGVQNNVYKISRGIDYTVQLSKPQTSDATATLKYVELSTAEEGVAMGNEGTYYTASIKYFSQTNPNAPTDPTRHINIIIKDNQGNEITTKTITFYLTGTTTSQTSGTACTVENLQGICKPTNECPDATKIKTVASCSPNICCLN